MTGVLFARNLEIIRSLLAVNKVVIDKLKANEHTRCLALGIKSSFYLKKIEGGILCEKEPLV